MPRAHFFSHLSLFVHEHFLDQDLCVNLRVHMRSSAHTPSRVGGSGREKGTAESSYIEHVDENIRSSKEAYVCPEMVAVIEQRLAALRPQLEQHFSLELTGHEAPQFLVYNAGDHFRFHRDRNEGANRLEYIRRRRVSVVVFLNGESETPGPDSYSGGALTFYGLIDEPLWKKCGLPLISTPGLLIAFPSEMSHEVTQVSQGERCTIVTWFF